MPGVGSTALLRIWMQDTGCIPRVRVFQWPGSVFGARYPALGVGPAPVPGTRSQVPGNRNPGHLYPTSCILHHASCIHILPERSVTPSLRHSVTSSLGLSHERLSS